MSVKRLLLVRFILYFTLLIILCKFSALFIEYVGSLYIAIFLFVKNLLAALQVTLSNGANTSILVKDMRSIKLEANTMKKKCEKFSRLSAYVHKKQWCLIVCIEMLHVACHNSGSNVCSTKQERKYFEFWFSMCVFMYMYLQLDIIT